MSDWNTYLRNDTMYGKGSSSFGKGRSYGRRYPLQEARSAMSGGGGGGSVVPVVSLDSAAGCCRVSECQQCREQGVMPHRANKDSYGGGIVNGAYSDDSSAPGSEMRQMPEQQQQPPIFLPIRQRSREECNGVEVVARAR